MKAKTEVEGLREEVRVNGEEEMYYTMMQQWSIMMMSCAPASCAPACVVFPCVQGISFKEP